MKRENTETEIVSLALKKKKKRKKENRKSDKTRSFFFFFFFETYIFWGCFRNKSYTMSALMCVEMYQTALKRLREQIVKQS